MFVCDQCQNKVWSKAMLKIHHNNLHQNLKYSCYTIGHQTSSKGWLRSHQSVVHELEGKKYQCTECSHQAETKSSLDQHNQAIHEGVWIPCNFKVSSHWTPASNTWRTEVYSQFINTSNLAKHQQSKHEGNKYPQREWAYQATTKGNLGQHQQAIHEGMKYLRRECSKTPAIKTWRE